MSSTPRLPACGGLHTPSFTLHRFWLDLLHEYVRLSRTSARPAQDEDVRKFVVTGSADYYAIAVLNHEATLIRKTVPLNAAVRTSGNRFGGSKFGAPSHSETDVAQLLATLSIASNLPTSTCNRHLSEICPDCWRPSTTTGRSRWGVCDSVPHKCSKVAQSARSAQRPVLRSFILLA